MGPDRRGGGQGLPRPVSSAAFLPRLFGEWVFTSLRTLQGRRKPGVACRGPPAFSRGPARSLAYSKYLPGTGSGKDRSQSVERRSESREAPWRGWDWNGLPPSGPPQLPPSCPRIIEGVTYPGNIKEKAAAQEQYSAAVARGESAGLVK